MRPGGGPLCLTWGATLLRGLQDVIADITKRMGYGMAEFIEKEVREEAARAHGPCGCRHAS